MIRWGSFGSFDKRVYANSKLHRYKMALNVWSDWLEVNINRTRTKLLFMSPSPFHISRSDNGDVVPICHSKVEPILEIEEPKAGLDRDMMHIVDSVIQQMKARGLNI
ncbi:hypothetical protein SASPL_105352 [Salvia splendens]|uniref:Trichome birefringence-like C-terminal domain-containing protein n=1 Tax=Salvia splendens TaxID=180675 RepID=A0A8X9A989_SALSN|nr:hypothetical protein SASPL_105352 [Salvia splendens]